MENILVKNTAQKEVRSLIETLTEYNAKPCFDKEMKLLKEKNRNVFESMILTCFEEHLKGNRIGPLCRKKKLNKALEFIIKYVSSVLQLRNRPYFNEVQDRLDQEEYYANIMGDQDSSEIITYEVLHNLLFSTYKHAKRRIGLWALIDRQEDGTLKCAYSNKVIENAECIRLCKADEEHLVPQSWHNKSKTHPGRDMHQIWVVEKSANGSRGNYVIGGVDNVTPTNKVGGLVYGKEREIKLKGRRGRKRSSRSGEKEEKVILKGNKSTRFIPHYNLGAICRATLYTLVCYEDTFHKSYFPLNALPWIIEKAVSEPVTLWEKHRNQELFRLQKNRNPFIDNPQWAKLISFEKGFK